MVLAVVVRPVRPGVRRIENLRRNAGALGGDVEAEYRVGLKGYAV
jgi:hypothetical protein